jgi:hypothetical protein
MKVSTDTILAYLIKKNKTNILIYFSTLQIVNFFFKNCFGSGSTAVIVTHDGTVKIPEQFR